MRKFFVFLIFCLTFLSLTYTPKKINAQIASPALSRNFTFTTATTSDNYGVIGTGISLHRLTWQPVAGTISACTIRLEGSDDNGNTWNTMTSTFTCTSSGATSFINSSYGLIRINNVSLTLGTGKGLNATWQGYFSPPAPIGVFSPANDPLSVVAGSVLFGSTTNLTTVGNGLYTVSTAPGILIAITNQTKAASAGTMACYDSANTGNLPAAGKVATIDTANTLQTYFYYRQMTAGIVCQQTGPSTDMTITYR